MVSSFAHLSSLIKVIRRDRHIPNWYNPGSDPGPVRRLTTSGPTLRELYKSWTNGDSVVHGLYIEAQHLQRIAQAVQMTKLQCANE